MMKKRKIGIIVFWLAVWQLVSIAVGNNILLVGPIQTIGALMTEGMTVGFWKTAAFSMLRIAAGFGAGFLLGLCLAACSARFLWIEELLSPLFSLMKAVPVASFVVLFLIWWHSDVLASAVSFFIVLPQIYISTLEGIRSTDRKLLEMAEVFRMSARNRFFYIYRSSLKPFLNSSIKIAAGMSWKSGVAAEVIGTPAYSVGERLYMSKISLDTAGVFAWTAVIILASILFEKLVFLLWNAFLSWEPSCLAPGKKTYGGQKTGIGKTRVEKISKAYDGQSVLKNVSAEYESGETYYFRTPSGSGKTTYFRILAGLEKPDAGSITKEPRISMVFQEDRLCEEYSAVKNVALVTGSEEEARKQLLKLLDEKDIDKPCGELSGGMRRRVALARAYAADSDVLLLDEPFTGLDNSTRERVLIYMKEEQRGRTVLIATHI